MGQHTWFIKDKELLKERNSLYDKLEKSDSYEEWMDEVDYRLIEERIEEIDALIDCDDFHDCFRTNKRNEDKTYIDEIIWSFEECIQWLKDNKEFVYSLNMAYVKFFWSKYPNGAIYFG